MKLEIVLVLAFLAAGCGGDSGGSGTGYAKTVAPIFEEKCLHCHWVGNPTQYQLVNPFDPNTGIVGRAGSWTEARNTVVVVPGSPEQSFLIDKVTATDLDPEIEGDHMPLNMPRLTTDEATSLRTWITDGANDDAFYQSNVAPIFGNGTSLGVRAGKCSYCHQTDAQNFPNLTTPFDESVGVVDVPAAVGGILVVPGDPENSVLYRKVTETNLPSSLKSPMPLQVPALSASEVSALETWIRDGANND